MFTSVIVNESGTLIVETTKLLFGMLVGTPDVNSVL